VIAGTHSGVGKTTIATGIMRALVARGLRVGSAKVGPDYIDPSYHSLATGRAPHSLDVFMSGESVLASLAGKASHDVDVLVIEGVMGLFDGSGEPGADGSTASVSRLLNAPVILVVDASAMSGSVAAVVLGFSSLDSSVQIAGVVLNRVGSEGHAQLLREALEPLKIPVLGILFTDASMVWRERHLGLVPVAEEPERLRASIDRLGETIERSLDLEAIMVLARSALETVVPDSPRARFVAQARIAVCGGPAFSFVYPENLELLAQAGAELVMFDPLRASSLPEGCGGLYAGGGFPEVFADVLGDNRSLLDDVRCQISDGLVTWAECGGFLWLCESFDSTRMAGVFDGVHAQMSERLTLGYRRVTTRDDGIFGPAGTVLRGHEYHRSVVSPPGDSMDLEGRFGTARGGFTTSTLFASYLHQHLAATPYLAERFVAAASLHSTSRDQST